MASFLSRLAPLVITLRGSKRMFSSRARTLAKINKLQAHPAPWQPPRSLSRTTEVSLREVDGWKIYSVAPRGVDAGRRVVLLHGGCYVFEIDPLHWRLAGNLAVEAGAIVTVPIMPLAPQGTAIEIVPAVADLVASLIDDVGAENVSIFGDSSGGGMALAVAMELRDRGLPPLHATLLSSPWLDISGTDPRLAEIAPRDPWLAVPGTQAAGELYRAGLSATDPRVSPINGLLVGLGPITMFSGTRDILNADAHRFVPLAAKANLALDYFEAPGMIHNYPIFPMPEGDEARAVMVAAITSTP